MAEADPEMELESYEEHLLAINSVQIYGCSTPGSFGRIVKLDDLAAFRVLILKVTYGDVTLSELINELIVSYRLNFIVHATKKISGGSGDRIYYLNVTYLDEIWRFLRSIKSETDYSFHVRESHIRVALCKNLVYGNCDIVAGTAQLVEDARFVNNIFLKYLPDDNVSPSSNLLRLINLIMTEKPVAEAFCGLNLRLNPDTGSLTKYASIIIDKKASNDIFSGLDKLMLEPKASNVSSFLLPDDQLKLCFDSNKKVALSETILVHNLLTNDNNRDNFSSFISNRQIAVASNDNNNAVSNHRASRSVGHNSIGYNRPYNRGRQLIRMRDLHLLMPLFVDSAMTSVRRMDVGRGGWRNHRRPYREH